MPWRLLAGRRVDQVWAIAADGAVEHWQIGDRIFVLSRLSLGGAPFDVTATSSYLAAVLVDEGAGRARAFRVRVLTESGEPVLERTLPGGPEPTGEDWAERAVENRHVALAEGEPLVAVGGPGALVSFSLGDGRVLGPR